MGSFIEVLMSKYLFTLFFIQTGLFLYSLTLGSLENSIFSVILFLSLCYASYVDLERMEIPDFVSIGLFPIGALWVLRFEADLLFQRLLEAIVMLLLFALFSRVYKYLRHREGLGFGDIKLIASSTIWLGMNNIPVMIFFAACSGLIASFYRFDKTVANTPDTRIPFGPHLAASIWFVWLLINFKWSNVAVMRLF